jgi:Ca2+-binding EF-hand superfamily protein
MRFVTLITAALVASATAASAMKATDLDIDGDGFASIGEVRQIFPGFSSNDFRDIDVNRDRRLSDSELNASGVSAIVGRYQDTMAIIHSLTDIDTSGDRFVSEEELGAVYNGVTANEFDLIDLNNDDRVSAQELYQPLAQAMLNRYEMGGRDLITIMQVDTDDDAFATLEELQSFYPGLTKSEFEIIDINGDNRLGSTEYYTTEAQEVFDKN